MEFIRALIFGIVEGITEWLPVSSTGHLILLNSFYKISDNENFVEVFNVVIQLGAIMAVVLIFWNQLWPFSLKEPGIIKKDIFSMWFKILVACLPAAVIGVLFDEKFEELFYNSKCVSMALILVGIIFIIVESRNNTQAKIESIMAITYKTAFIIGIFQLVAAIFPGVSRSGATIIGALMIGVSRKTAAEFTFFLAVPVMFGASLLKLVKSGMDFTTNEYIMLGVGTLSAFLISIVIIKFLLSYIKKHDFKVFAYYRIAVGILVLVLGYMNMIKIS